MSDRDAGTAGRVTKVRIFIDRAAITRTRVIEQPLPEISFATLPIETDMASLRAHAEGSGGAKLKVTGATGEPDRQPELHQGRVEPAAVAQQDAARVPGHRQGPRVGVLGQDPVRQRLGARGIGSCFMLSNSCF